MAMMLGSLRVALIKAGASEEKADKAAEEGAVYETRLAGLETRVSVLTWMSGANLGLTLLVLGGLVTLTVRFGETNGLIGQLARCVY